jgi:hypothetical protein
MFGFLLSAHIPAAGARSAVAANSTLKNFLA